jgi:hypothetical protein
VRADGVERLQLREDRDGDNPGSAGFQPALVALPFGHLVILWKAG